jgi:NAD-dependent SIR2 family protein deacetylase
MDNQETIRELVRDADMVLVGIGEAFQSTFQEVTVEEKNKGTVFEEYARREYLDTHREEEADAAYAGLARLLEGKNYFVVTLCDDDKIYHAGLKNERIVAPCGTYQALQCEDVCTTDIYPAEDFVQEIEHGEAPRCPHCGKALVMNRIGCTKYSEEGYLKQWEIYTKWLQGTLNRQLCILELGVGMKYPSVIRWPFEKVAFFNNKAKFVRIHTSLYQMAEEIKEKGVPMQENPVELMSRF